MIRLPFAVLQAGEQGPIDFVALYQAYGVNLGIDVSLGNKAAPSLVAEKSDWRSFEDRIKDEEDPYDLPLVYVGGHQVGGPADSSCCNQSFTFACYTVNLLCIVPFSASQ